MKTKLFILTAIFLLALSACKKIFFFKNKTILFRTELKNTKIKIYYKDADTDSIINTNVSDNIYFYYIKWNDSLQEEQIMRCNSKTGNDSIYGVISDLKTIKNFSEIYSYPDIFVLGDNDFVYKFNLKEKLNVKIKAFNADFIAGVNDNKIYAAKWNDNSFEEQVYTFDEQADSEYIGAVDSLKFIKNAQVLMNDKKIYFLGGDNSINTKIYIYDTKNQTTDIIKNNVDLDFIAGIYKNQIIALKWNDNKKQEEVFAVEYNGTSKYLGKIDGLVSIINCGVTMLSNKVFVLGVSSLGQKELFSFELK
jgi:hypothetical protein